MVLIKSHDPKISIMSLTSLCLKTPCRRSFPFTLLSHPKTYSNLMYSSTPSTSSRKTDSGEVSNSPSTQLYFYSPFQPTYENLTDTTYKLLSPWNSIPLLTCSTRNNISCLPFNDILAKSVKFVNFHYEMQQQQMPLVMKRDFYYPATLDFKPSTTLMKSAESGLNFIVEIPQHTVEKYEMSTILRYNPIVPTFKKNGTLRSYAMGPLPWNYGFFPQTWEPPFVHFHGYPGDGDPIDVLELGDEPLPRGAVIPVHILGALALIDQGEMDYKILTLRLSKSSLLSPEERQSLLFKVLDPIRFWFQYYKVLEGRNQNQFLYRGECLSCEFALHVVLKAHDHWNRFIKSIAQNEALAL